MKNLSHRGFTVYELLITLLIVGVVLTLGIPNLSEFTQNSRIASTVNDLHSSFMVGRSEAARSKSNVTICTSADPLGAAPACDGGSFDEGWIIFEDTDGDIVRDAGEPIIRRHPPIPDGIDILSEDDATYFSFAPSGLGRGDVAGPSFESARLCDERGNQTAAGGSSSARYLAVTPVGRSAIVRDVAVIEDRGGCP